MTTRRRYMTGATLAIDAMLASLPSDDRERARLLARAVKYNRECGCALGGFSLVAALLLASTYLAVSGDLSLRTAAASVLFVLAAALLGKVTGLLLASVRLALLRWSLTRMVQLPRRVGHVDVH